jgi:hypothetical protein
MLGSAGHDEFGRMVVPTSYRCLYHLVSSQLGVYLGVPVGRGFPGLHILALNRQFSSINVDANSGTPSRLNRLERSSRLNAATLSRILTRWSSATKPPVEVGFI